MGDWDIDRAWKRRMGLFLAGLALVGALWIAGVLPRWAMGVGVLLLTLVNPMPYRRSGPEWRADAPRTR